MHSPSPRVFTAWTAVALALAMLFAPIPPTDSSSTAEAETTDCLDVAMDLGLVIDRSGSMRLDLTEATSKAMAYLALPEQRAGLVSYNHDSYLDHPMSEGLNDTVEIPDQINLTRDPINLLENPGLLDDRTLRAGSLGDATLELYPDGPPQVHPDLVDAIEDLQATGSTATGLGIDESHDDFRNNGDPEAEDLMVLLSDGHTNDGPTSDPIAYAEEQAQEAKDDGITIIAIGVGENPNHAHLQRIASDGFYYHALDEAEASEIAREVVMTVGMFMGSPLTGQEAPRLSNLDLQGMLAGVHAWTERPYQFDASDVFDADGDNVTATWEWSDGVTDTGTTVDRQLSSPEKLSTVLEIVDDPTDRCPELPEVVHSIPIEGVLRTVPDFATTLGVTPGMSCNAGEKVPSEHISEVGDLIAGSCTLDTGVDHGEVTSDIVEQFVVTHDGDTLADPDGTAYTLDYDATEFADGEHTLEVCSSAVNDTVYDRQFCSTYEYTDTDCSTEPPQADYKANGMTDGFVGWASEYYTFEAEDIQDPDGHPVEVTWTWPNGSQASGDEATAIFHNVGDHTVQVELAEDPPCDALAGYSVVNHPTFEVVEGPDSWPIQLDRPSADADWSCVGATWVPTAPGAPNSAAGRCPVEASASPIDLLEPAVEGEFALFNQQGDQVAAFGADSGTDLSAVYESVDYPSQQLLLGACFGVDGDIHDKEGCSGQYSFWNVGAGLG